jgi:uncharacterized protein YdaU (DUF1376 family)
VAQVSAPCLRAEQRSRSKRWRKIKRSLLSYFVLAGPFDMRAWGQGRVRGELDARKKEGEFTAMSDGARTGTLFGS